MVTGYKLDWYENSLVLIQVSIHQLPIHLSVCVCVLAFYFVGFLNYFIYLINFIYLFIFLLLLLLLLILLLLLLLLVFVIVCFFGRVIGWFVGLIFFLLRFLFFEATPNCVWVPRLFNNFFHLIYNQLGSP